ncbi:DUF4190 domain-containing protein [Brevibacterium antiquum]|uniref:Uncharacterized membrane protein YeaQ/YmgE, transglycosylase-associated protein family n=1 Tax=Brevibacterium antiquum CNRZ 918 TaxID=1255637 RepID=A0A2H1JQP4_9MICO|nr:DUF4190 domain-containing protein [Brevibacterium antiquum]SMX89816.1 Uncharacterized membrane protein YeaQ/YmgE, transglycosylase-associated protein family [Brevibacterium antiquum CNRZ 918]
MSQNFDPNSRPIQSPIQGQPQGTQYQEPDMQANAHPQYSDANAYGEDGQWAGGNFARPTRKRQKNVMGIVAFILAVVGFIFGCIPGALILGWILLPIAFLLAIISFFLKGGKGLSIAALILSVVGTIVAILVFFFVVASSFDDAFSDDVSAEPPAEEVVAEAGAEEGTRENPYSIGTKISSDAWEMTITNVTLDATDQVLAENEFNESPDAGNQYMMIDVEMTYTGDAPDGEMPMATFEYVSAGGNTFDGLDDMVVAPNALDTLENMYNGATTSGSIAIQIPSEDADAGVLAVNPDMFADKVYVAVK